MSQDLLAIICVFAPLAGAIIAGLGQKALGDRASMALTTGLLFLAAAAGISLFLGHAFGDHGGEGGHHATGAHVVHLMRWIDIGTFEANWSIRIDAISVTMMAVVTSVSALVHLYSVGYMAEDPHRARFFSYLSLFTFMMLMLVTANDFLQLFFGWEGVGLASYLLIGFWYKKASANDASIKAFVVNRVGDFGFALGIFAVYTVFGTIQFDPIFAAITANAVVDPLGAALPGPVRSLGFEFVGYTVPALELIGVLLFIGAMGKSAQFFLHTWLPDAMEGPTPVSALIHAATMVTAGVVLVCRCSYIYEYAPFAAAVITVVGAVTALYAATVGLAQNDIKRVIAYSTCSQLGYMFFAAGIGAYQAAMFHLFTHAFFKALLFLGAGSVIHGLHHEQDMRRMGGIWKAMPLTWGVMLIGTLAITGVGIPHTQIGFAGFFSKDAIIETSFAASLKAVPFAEFAFWIALTAAFLTSFYSWRLAYMTFHGPYVGGHEHHEGHAPAHAAHGASPDAGHNIGGNPSGAHEGPWAMRLPLILLAVGAVVAGFVFYDAMVGHHAKDFWGASIHVAADNTVLKDKYDIPEWVFWAPLVVTVAGFVLASIFYFFNHGLGAKIAARGGPLHSLLANKWYFDEIYDFVFVKGIARLSDWLAFVFDRKVIDGGGPNGVAALAGMFARVTSRLHSGLVYHYAFVALAAAALFGAIVLGQMQGAAQ
jgi:NADH-quinone oxidoreductase subunit L